MGILSFLTGADRKITPIQIEVKELMAIDYVALKTYILSGPNAATFAADVAAGNDNNISSALNAVRTGNKVNTGKIAANEFVKIFNGSEYIALSQAARDYLQLLTAAGTISVNDATVITNLSALFGAGSQTRANFIAAQQRDGSWAEGLFGVGTFITDADVAQALRG